MKASPIMDLRLYQYITTPIIFGIWLVIVISAVRAYGRIIKQKGLSPYMTKRDLKEIKDPEVLAAFIQWKRKRRFLFLIWLITGFGFIILSLIIERTVGFK